MKRLAFAIATGLGTGLSPRAPGTTGSLMGLLIFVLALSPRAPWIQVLVILLSGAVAFWACTTMERRTGRHDDQRIVIDEVLGIWITLCGFSANWVYLLTGFLLFRIMDIHKPFPANWADQKWSGATGVLMDDVIAGIYAHAALHVLIRFEHLL